MFNRFGGAAIERSLWRFDRVINHCRTTATRSKRNSSQNRSGCVKRCEHFWLNSGAFDDLVYGYPISYFDPENGTV